MILSMKEQGLIFVFVCLLGFGFGFLYDIFRIYRKCFKTPALLCAAEDFIFWVLAAFTVFYFLLGLNYGGVRLYMVLGFMGGMILYYLTVSPRFMLLSLTVLKLLKNRILTVLNPLFRAADYIKIHLKKPAKKLISHINIKRKQKGKNR